MKKLILAGIFGLVALFANDAIVLKKHEDTSYPYFMGEGKNTIVIFYSNYNQTALDEALNFLKTSMCGKPLTRKYIKKGNKVIFIYLDKKNGNIKTFIIDSCN